MKKVFITGTFRNEWNKGFNLRLCEYLEKNGCTCYLPQRNTEQKGNRKNTFEQNIAGILGSDIIVAIGAKTQTANWGLEIGYGYAMNKQVVVLTDRGHPVELMPEGAAGEVLSVDSLDDLAGYGDRLLGCISKMGKAA